MILWCKEQVDQVEFHELLQQADAISIHVPLTITGAYPTYHLFNAASLAHMRPDAILINSARGPVIEEAALIQDIQATHRTVVLDVLSMSR